MLTLLCTAWLVGAAISLGMFIAGLGTFNKIHSTNTAQKALIGTIFFIGSWVIIGVAIGSYLDEISYKHPEQPTPILERRHTCQKTTI